MSTIKQLWNNRRATAWIFIELVIITIITWIIADPVTISVYDSNLPMGYDNDRLVILQMTSFASDVPGFDASRDSLEVNKSDVEAVMMKIRNYPGVESVTIDEGFGLPGADSNSLDHYDIGDEVVDTVVKSVNAFVYHTGTNFFETLGMKSVEGSPTVEELSATCTAPDKVIITSDVARLYWPGENAVGKKFLRWTDDEGNQHFTTVIGVVSGIRHQLPFRSYCATFYCGDHMFPDEPLRNFKVVARLSDPSKTDAIVDELYDWGNRELAIGNFYLRSVQTYNAFLEDTNRMHGIPNKLNLRYILAGFFLVNLILGVVGTFWLQTRKRITEMGIRRAFGAPRGNIVGLMLGENLLLATVACLTGVFIYWQYALRNGLAIGYDKNEIINVVDNWIAHFGQHFIVISAIVYALILICVTVGTLLPAMSVSRIDIVDSLRSKE